MTDREEFTRPFPTPDDWETLPVFRETFLRLHLQTEDADNLRTFGRWLYATALEPPVLSETGTPPELGESITRASLRAAACDLLYLQGFLADAAQDLNLSQLNAEDVRLARAAEGFAVEVGGLAGRVLGLVE